MKDPRILLFYILYPVPKRFSQLRQFLHSYVNQLRDSIGYKFIIIFLGKRFNNNNIVSFSYFFNYLNYQYKTEIDAKFAA